MDLEKFSSWVKSEMKRANIRNQAELAQRSNLSPSQVSKILSMDSPPGQKALIKLAQGLGLPRDVVLAQAEIISAKTNDPYLATLAHLMRQMSRPDKDDLVDYAKLRAEQARKRNLVNDVAARLEHLSPTEALDLLQEVAVKLGFTDGGGLRE